LRGSGLTNLLELTGSRGLSTVLRGHEALAESAPDNVVSLPQPGLDVIPSGPHPVNSGDVQAEDRYRELLDWAAAKYDQILVDCPPLLPGSDAWKIARVGDGVLFVVQPEKNRRKLVLQAAESFQAGRLKLLGILANRFPANLAISGDANPARLPAVAEVPCLPEKPSRGSWLANLLRTGTR
jgi:polysaccharide biosynthesis transport protein